MKGKLKTLDARDLSAYSKQIAERITQVSTEVEKNRELAQQANAEIIAKVGKDLAEAQGAEQLINDSIREAIGQSAEAILAAESKVVASLREDIDATNSVLKSKADAESVSNGFDKVMSNLAGKVDFPSFNDLSDRVRIAENDIDYIVEVGNSNVDSVNKSFDTLLG
jgi:hypothetical protein